MILETPKELPTGVQVSYWEVALTNINYIDKVAHCVRAYWLDEGARLAGKQPVYLESVDFDPSNFPFESTELEKKGVTAVSLTTDKIEEFEQELAAQTEIAQNIVEEPAEEGVVENG